MESLSELIARYAQPGRILWIGRRVARRAAMQMLDRVWIDAQGLTGDHGVSVKRAVTLIQQEHLAVIGAMLGRGPVAPADLRRNLVVAGLNLTALRGRRVEVGSTLLEITGPCAPCSRMEETLGRGGYSALRGHGGFCAAVIRPGWVALGDAMKPIGDGQSVTDKG